MKEEKKLVPKRRFRGFEGEWEGFRLSEITNITMGHSPNSANYTSNPSDYVLVQGNADIKNNRVFPRVWTTQVTKMATKNDMILTVRAPVGEVAKTDYDVVLGRGVAAIKGNEFIFQHLIKMKKEGYWNNLSTGSTFDSVNSDDINNVSLLIPNEAEQQKIGQFFKLLDERIVNQEKKIAKIKSLKSAYLNEMFPQEGETVPKRRFRDFNGEWKVKLVSEVGNKYYGGGTPKTIIKEYWNGDIPWIQSSDIGENTIHVNEQVRTITKQGLANSATKLVPKNSIAIVTRVGVGKLAYVPYEYATSQDFLSISDLNVDYHFGTYALYRLLQKEKNSVQGTSIKGITKDELLSKTLMIPTDIKEQQKIGEFFKNLDNQIATEERKLAKLKAMKEAYLEEMFV